VIALAGSEAANGSTPAIAVASTRNLFLISRSINAESHLRSDSDELRRVILQRLTDSFLGVRRVIYRSMLPNYPTTADVRSALVSY
jgi:hypothetical protein